MNAQHDGQEAARILDADVFKKAVRAAAERIKDEWSTATASNQRETLWHELKALDRLPRELRVIRDRGVVAARENSK